MQELEVLKSYLANIEHKIQQASEKDADNSEPELLNHKIAEVKRRMEENKRDIIQNIDDNLVIQKKHKEDKTHKPKHPVSSFFVFYKEKGQSIAQKKGLTVGSKVAKYVGELWKQMSSQEKEPYEA